MEQWILEHEVTIRLACFFGILALMMCLERFIPRRRRSLTRWQRWPANLSIVVPKAIELSKNVKNAGAALITLKGLKNAAGGIQSRSRPGGDVSAIDLGRLGWATLRLRFQPDVVAAGS